MPVSCYPLPRMCGWECPHDSRRDGGSTKPIILPRTSAACSMGGRCSLPGFSGDLIRCLCSSHGGSHAPLFLGCELEDVIHQQLGLVLLVTLERRWRRSGENPMIVLP